MVAQEIASAAHDAGCAGNGALTMEKKLRLWKQAKLDKQRAAQHRRNSVAVIRHGTGEKISNSGLVKRKFAERSRTITDRSSNTLRSSLSVSKKSRYSEVIRHTTSHSSPVAKEVAAINRELAPKSATKARGSAKFPVVIEDTPEPSLVECDEPAHSQLNRSEDAALEKKNQTAPSLKLLVPVITVKKTSGLPAEDLIKESRLPGILCTESNHAILPTEKVTEVLTPLNKDLPTQIPRSMPVLNLDIPVATITQSLPDPSATSEPSKDWNADPALDKENQTNVVGFPIQNLRAPVITVEKKPELLAKDLIKVAISFQNRHRMATALSVFKRAYHMLPKKSTKLVERLMYLEREHPIAVGQVPSQDMSTTAYMVKVLECDLMAVLNYGTIKELTELHAIGAKRAEFVLDKRPYHQLEELQRVPGISSNIVARLHGHHTNWETHL
ncbi:hypothetical protein AM587_10016122 [Phytophthora nicotianae]|uniref:Uncharacterized protein n=1 Tax=Phytophthora nicotianae TaxID=4792 RepID=A0A0W8BKA7_PHYNI|nr:hypothetical protein AM587_10016122 [Phytophthora nicotianae]